VQQTARRTMIADVARAAGVSKSAVSFAFNAPERLSAVTVARIREIANAMNYRPDPVARMLAQRRTMTIGVLTPQGLDEVFTNPYFGSLAAGVATAAESAGYVLQFISPLRGSLGRAVDQASVDGILAVGLWSNHPEIGMIRRSGIPFVLVDSTALPREPSVRVDDEGGARAAAEHLVGLGHRQFAVLAFTPPDEDEPTVPDSGALDRHRSARAVDVSALRLRGYRAALQAAGIELAREAVASSPSTLEGGAEGLRLLVKGGLRATAVLAMSDALAIGAMRAARELGLRVPDDISIVGFDDIDLAQYTDPQLTTVHQPGRQKGAAAMRMLLERLERREPSGSQQVLLETRLIIRGSTGPEPHARQEVTRSD
jgi:DNA-binding LacI/PurR family transcriptional regulator